MLKDQGEAIALDAVPEAGAPPPSSTPIRPRGWLPAPPLFRRSLPNGLEVRLRQVPLQLTVNLGLFFRHGSQHESPETNGIAHFIEHVAFNPRYLVPAVRHRLDRLLDRGASYDAFTSKEYTRLMITCLPEQLTEALRVLGSVVRADHIGEDAVRAERPIVLQEHATTFASPRTIHGQLLDHALWGDCSIGLFIMGRRENIERFTAGELEDRIRRHYRPDRSCLVIAGPVPTVAVGEEVLRWLGDWRAAEASFNEPEASPRPATTVFSGESSRSELLLGFPGAPFESEQRPAMELLADILGGGIKSRLFLELRERRKLVYLVQGYPVSYQGGGYIGIRTNCEASKLEVVHDAIQGILRSVREDGVTTAELARAKAARLMRLFEAADNPARYIQLAGRRCVLGEDFSTDAEAARISAIGLKDVNRLATEILYRDLSSVVVLSAPEGGLGFLNRPDQQQEVSA